MTIDTLLHTMRVEAEFSGLLGTTTVAHIHAPTAIPLTGTVGVATYPGTFPGFPVGVTSGTYDATFDLTQNATYTTAFRTLGGGTAAGAEAMLISSLDDQKAYFNVHSTFAPGGEIRGFLQAVPEPSTVALLSCGALALARYGVRRRKAKV